jgi:hypothetical protein
MATSAYWSPNQAAVAQVETYTFTIPSGVGNTYIATINGKSLVYSSVSGDTAATVASAVAALLASVAGTGSGPAELAEILFANPSAGVVTATALVPGIPFANVTIRGVAGQGLVMSTGNGLVNGIATAHTTANASPSDVGDPQNWLRFTAPAPGVRALPQNGDNVVVAGSSVPMLWNLDALSSIQFGSYTRWQSMTAPIGLPYVNAGAYNEWRATYFRFVGPAGSVPAGGLTMILGQGAGSGPTLEQYDLQSQQATLVILAAGVVRFLGVHTNNTFTALGGADLEIAAQNGEIATLSSSTLDGGATLTIGAGVTWTAASTLTVVGGTTTLYAAPQTLSASGGASVTFATDQLTWSTINAQGGCTLTWLAGGTLTTLTMSVGCTLDKSQDARALTIVNSTIDGDTCRIVDPLNAIAFTNATSVKQSVAQGPFQFTGTRTVKVV